MPLATMRPLRDFLPLVLPYAPNCPNIVAEQKLRLAAIEFCERTEAWREIITQQVTTAEVTIAIPDYATIDRFEHVRFDEQVLIPMAYEDICPDVVDMPPAGYAQVHENEILMDTTPSAEGTLVSSLFMKPRGGSIFGRVPEDPMQDYLSQVPDFMFKNHAETLSWGALARILNIPKEDYTDPVMAKDYTMKFEAKLQSRSSTGAQGQQRRRLRAKAEFF